ncbi:MAG: LmeA-like phospholipid-binding, partial [Frankiaceae bacterium]|nr:LmeA-like phospholipid-binding [Frankiaceae bacterium]
MLKRLAVALLVLLGLLAVADRYIASAAGSAAGGQVRRAIDTPANPHVTFGGFPFLTQALFGHFS